MAGTPFFCCNDARRAALKEVPSLNGIDFLEVGDLDPADLGPSEAAEFAALPPTVRDRLLWQRKLTLTFVNPLLPAHLAALTADRIRLEGGESAAAASLSVVVLSIASSSLVLRASARGDFSIYRLRIVAAADSNDPPAAFDPPLSVVDFSFKVECAGDFDCAVPRACPPEPHPSPEIDYLARDYASFRRLLLDRIGTLAPAWRERHAADLGVALVEILAYVGDSLSYRQESVATEAYLGTARKRISVRRHARLVDYPMHDGCNARAWVHVEVDPNAPTTGIVLPRVDPGTGVPTRFLTRADAPPALDDAQADTVIATRRPEVFEQLDDDVTLYPQFNEIGLYAWGAGDCCLPKGATRATLAGRLDALEVGRVLILEEIRGPKTGIAADADPARRHAVRLTRRTIAHDPLGGRFLDPPTSGAVDVTEIEWSDADALPFALCVSATIEGSKGETQSIGVGVARGNVVLVDHGRTVTESLPVAVPKPSIARPAPESESCEHSSPEWIPARYAPTLALAPVTQASPFDAAAPAAAAMQFDVAGALPSVHLASDATQDRWDPRRDLLRSSASARDFVVEIESDGVAQIRFGDGRNGFRPVAGTTFAATYRVGNGLRGNVGADAIAHVATSTGGIQLVRNPLPASGGVDPEPIEQVRRFAPEAFRTQERAVTADDYARMAERSPRVQRAAATFRWTGSWRTAFVTVDPFGGGDVGAELDAAVAAHLERFRMAGQDLEVDGPRYVPLEIAMTVCAKAGYFRADVLRALLEIFSSRILPDGRKGVFHPDSFTFGQPVFLSPLYAAAFAVAGVESVRVVKFQRRGTPDPAPLQSGRLNLGRLEIARLDNDPSRPDRGVFNVAVAGGA